MPVKIFRYGFHVFLSACPTVTTSISGKSFHFPFPYFVPFCINLIIIVENPGLKSFILLWEH
jgi:hypothetical protein